jgi:hypothetical protein
MGDCRLFLFLSFAYRLFLFSVPLFLDWRRPTVWLTLSPVVWLTLSPAVWLMLSPRGLAHAFADGLAQAFAACCLLLSSAGGLKPSP